MKRKQNIFIITIVVLTTLFSACRRDNMLRSPVGYRIEGSDVIFEFDIREYKKVTKPKASGQLDFEDIDIKAIAISGEFNNWSEDGWKMTQVDEFVFQLRKPLKEFKDQYKWEYKYIINGEYWAEPPVYASNKTQVYPLKNSENLVLYTQVPSMKGNTSFELEGFQNAKQVYLSGSFVDWKEDSLLCSKEDSSWVAKVDLGEGKHLYKFIVDGKWHHDPTNPFAEPDGHQGLNSILYKANTLFELKGFDSAKEVYIAGDFNNWETKSHPCIRKGDKWVAKVFLGSGKHQYKFIVDGEWTLDPDNPVTELEKGMYLNSVIFKGNVTFRLAGYPKAKKVYIAGDFNDWNPRKYKMILEDGIWVYSLELPKGQHKYKFIIDGHWITDPANLAQDIDKEGNVNSILVVKKE